MVLPHADRAAAEAVAADVVAAVACSTPERLTVSCGIALFGPDRPTDPESLLASADRAMYGAKHGGRNRALVAAPA